MRLIEKFTYKGGPLDGQDANPTSARGKGYTKYRDAEGKPLRTYHGDRWMADERQGALTRPGFYWRRGGTDTIRPADENVPGLMIMPGEYRWMPPNK